MNGASVCIEHVFLNNIQIKAVALTDPLLRKRLREPISDQLKDVTSLTPTTDAVQQLAVLCSRSI